MLTVTLGGVGSREDQFRSAARKTKLGPTLVLLGVRNSSVGAPRAAQGRLGEPIVFSLPFTAFAALRESLRNSTQISGKSSVSRYALRGRADGVREPRPGLNSLAQAPPARRGG